MTAFGRQPVCETCRDLTIEGEKAIMCAHRSDLGVETLHCMQALETAEAGTLPVDEALQEVGDALQQSGAQDPIRDDSSPRREPRLPAMSYQQFHTTDQHRALYPVDPVSVSTTGMRLNRVLKVHLSEEDFCQSDTTRQSPASEAQPTGAPPGACQVCYLYGEKMNHCSGCFFRTCGFCRAKCGDRCPNCRVTDRDLARTERDLLR